MSSPTSSSSGATLTEVVLPGVVEPDGLIVQERAIPDPGKGQALVEMLATGVSFGEQGCVAAATRASRTSRSCSATTSSAS